MFKSSQRSTCIELEKISVIDDTSMGNPILVGAPGVGKTIVVEDLTQHIIHGMQPHWSVGQQIWLRLVLGPGGAE